MIELVIVSRLLEYPDAALAQHQQELFDALASSENLDKEDAQRWAFSSATCWRAIFWMRRRTTASCLTGGVRPRCCCLNTFTVNPATAVRRWLT
jgi:hypothetical protein